MYRQIFIIRIMEYPQPGRMVPNQKYTSENLLFLDYLIYTLGRRVSC